MHYNSGGMSFKNLYVFNLAMLREQGRSLVTNPNPNILMLEQHY